MTRLLATSLLLIGLMATATAQATIPGTYGPVTIMPPPLQTAPQVPNSPPPLYTFGDKVTRCVHYGSSQGVAPGQIGQYTRECANTQ